MRIEKVTRESIWVWSSFWMEQEERIEDSFIRPMQEAYFEHKYGEHAQMEGYCVMEGEKAAAFFGTEYKKKDGFSTVSFCDFIMNPEFRGKGVFTEMVSLIQNELFVNGEVLVFQPINRQAMISWKFALNPSVTFRLNRFVIGMKKEEKPDTQYEFSLEKPEAGQYLRKLAATKEGKLQGNLMVNEIHRDRTKGLEICQVSGMEEQNLPELFTALFSWMAMEDYDFVMVKVSEHYSFHEWLEGLEGYQKEKEVLYQFFVADKALVPKIKEQNLKEVGELLDIPRTDGLLRKFQKKSAHMQNKGEENGGAHEG